MPITVEEYLENDVAKKTNHKEQTDSINSQNIMQSYLRMRHMTKPVIEIITL